jgi:hypothetical protein
VCLVISIIAKAAHVGLKEVLSFALGSRVRLPATLSTWQKAPRKQTESLQRGERSMCAISGREQMRQILSQSELSIISASSMASRQHGWS